MIFTDSILTPLIVIGAFAYFALKSLSSSAKGFSEDENKCKKENDEFIKWFKEQEEKRAPENIRYQKWLYDHRQD